MKNLTFEDLASIEGGDATVNGFCDTIVALSFVGMWLALTPVGAGVLIVSNAACWGYGVYEHLN